jgi:hypothetical protein
MCSQTLTIEKALAEPIAEYDQFGRLLPGPGLTKTEKKTLVCFTKWKSARHLLVKAK